MTGKETLSYRLSTLSIHADTGSTPDVAPPMHVSTNYRFANDWNDRYAAEKGWIPKSTSSAKETALTPNGEHVYSREGTETRDRLETVLGALEGGHAVTYTTGLAAITAAINHVQPSRIVTSREGYHGTHGVIRIYRRGREDKVGLVFIEDGIQTFQKGDLIWLESPQNPRGEIAGIHCRLCISSPSGATLAVDATFAPAPLQKTLAAGADIVMHSSTKFLGGHSDMLGGVLIVKDEQTAEKLRDDRTYLGSVMGNFEAWLLLRSLRSLTVRVTQQSRSATEIARWLDARDEPATQIVDKVWHGSLPKQPGHDAGKKQGEGWSGVLSIEFKSLHHARLIGSHLRLVVNATSLGGCESALEWRAVVDDKITPRLVRLSIGLEDVEDLKEDLRRGFLKVAEIAKEFEN
ncbi:uncharacterized protein SPPG_05320 [Spizellomyces punctatus DAOM BR117]|uniref:Cystathionine gamma-synthase n=1 Tax=Spizellomyces punctatus (strain DAOM BR117) TaxID=645134 RepID=A0A0L0HFS0_SPIPD|nr:uncharacterized protein SPPG_05320 [Spizellomyces punctatus DAOM BR117]KNC99947.1 hypothetical protein SPPG_05320 [Spizellomyces punctatus DAOM BR117]|eukprot:XP_016607987.1 hypothetical protein SPPG_05320 [Spizellomyces punctatus DAOM BR117]